MEAESTHALNSVSIPPVRLRSYQDEMLEQSLRRNVIVAMETGSGKTNIAIARIRAEVENPSSVSKIVWFIAPSVALSEQQRNVIQEQLPAYQVRTLIGNDGLDKWTEQRLWDAVLTNVNIVVGTPAVLQDALTHGFVQMSRLALIVFDEAHRCIKESPMNVIMRDFYHASKWKSQPIPSILGLTASPVMNAKPGSLEKIERNLDSIAITPKRHRQELERYVHPPHMDLVVYGQTDMTATGPHLKLYTALCTATATYDLATDPYVKELSNQNDEKSTQQLRKVMTIGRTYCVDQLRKLKTRAETLIEEVGPSMADWYLFTCISRFREGFSSDTSITPDITEKEKHHLSDIFNRISHSSRNHNDHTSPTDLVPSIKAQRLMETLIRLISPGMRGIIFVEQRATVIALANALRLTPRLSSQSIGTFVGMSQNHKRQANIADISDVKNQHKDLTGFRNGEISLMVTTSVLEEGIDISACNIVVCYDPPANLVSFVQRRGRARQQQSRYLIFLRNDDDKRHPAKWNRLEAEMKEAYMSDMRAVVDEDDEEEEENVRHYRVGDALLTSNNAKAHLYHFCATGMLTSSYIDPNPEFEYIEHDTKLFSATVSLPNFVHHSIRYASSSQHWRTQTAAIKDAAFEAYVALHKAGLVNDNLLPMVKDHGPGAGQIHQDQPSIVEVSERVDCWKLALEQCSHDSVWHQSTAILSLMGSSVAEFDFYLPGYSSNDVLTDLYWNENTTYQVALRSTGGTMPNNDGVLMSTLQKSTDLLLRSIHSSRMSSDNDYVVLFAPTNAQHLDRWLEHSEGSKSARKAIVEHESNPPYGLVRQADQPDHAYVFKNIQYGSEEELEFCVTNFPKRRDFLHPVVDPGGVSSAYSATRVISLDSCEVDNLSGTEALFAVFVPSIIHRIDVGWLITSLQGTVLAPVGIRDTSLIAEAISSPAAHEPSDYNRLEFLGDTVLKFCTSLQVTARYLTWPEAYLSSEKDRVVRNSNLATAAIEAGLDRYILTRSFTGSKWRPVYISEVLASPATTTRNMSSKVLADVVEALFGAAFVDGGLPKAFTCIKTLLPCETWYEHSEISTHLLSEVDMCETAPLGLLEQLIGHKFTHQGLLLETITHASFPHNKTGMSYERLEFLGDAVLDILITPQLFAHARKLRHWDLHRVHEVLVNRHILGFCCMSYSIPQEKFDIVERQSSSGPAQQEVSTSTKRVHLHDFLRASGELLRDKRTSLQAFDAQRAAISNALEHSPVYPWSALIALKPPKFFSDIIESILGALYVDTRGDLAVCAAFVERLGITGYMRRFLDQHVETAYPKERVGILADREAVEYLTSREGGEDGARGSWSCTVRVGEGDVVTVDECAGREEAEVKAAEEAAEILQRRPGSGGLSKRRKLDVMAVE